jgi:hypothetical protein
MDLGTPLVTNAQAGESAERGYGSLDHPPEPGQQRRQTRTGQAAIQPSYPKATSAE